MSLRRASLAGAFALLPALGAAAQTPSAVHLYRFGETFIRCVKEPCPRVGVVQLDRHGGPRKGWPVYSGPRPPSLVGSPDDRSAVERAWEPGGCLKVEGAFVRPDEFEITRIVGACDR